MKNIIKYQIFISSTYENLQLERQHAIKAILESNCIPSAMEFFPSSNFTIKGLLSDILTDCDFVILIISNSYGQKCTVTNLSYTEIEYDISKENGIPVCCFFKKGIDDFLTTNKDLERFVNKIRTASTPIKFWDNELELESHIKSNISHMKENRPSSGWIRANNDYVVDLKIDFHRLEKENSMLVDDISKKDAKILGLMGEVYALEKSNDFIEQWGNKYRKPQKKINSILKKLWNKSSIIDELLYRIDELKLEKHKIKRNLSVEENYLDICEESLKDYQSKLNECRENIVKYKSALSILQRL